MEVEAEDDDGQIGQECKAVGVRECLISSSPEARKPGGEKREKEGYLAGIRQRLNQDAVKGLRTFPPQNYVVIVLRPS